MRSTFLLSVLMSCVFVVSSASAQAPPRRTPLTASEVRELQTQLRAAPEDGARISQLLRLQNTARSVPVAAVRALASTVSNACPRLRAAQLLCRLAHTRSAATATQLRSVLAADERMRFAGFVQETDGCGPPAPPSGRRGLFGISTLSLGAAAGASAGLGSGLGRPVELSCTCDDECVLGRSCCGHPVARHRDAPPDNQGCACGVDYTYRAELYASTPACIQGRCQLPRLGQASDGASESSPRGLVNVQGIEVLSGELDAAGQQRLRASLEQRLRVEYTRVLRSNPSLVGTWSFTLEFGANGSVTTAEPLGASVFAQSAVWPGFRGALGHVVGVPSAVPLRVRVSLAMSLQR